MEKTEAQKQAELKEQQEQKKLEELSTSQLQEQINALTQLVSDKGNSDSKKLEQDKLVAANKEAAKLKAEADIKNLLSGSGDDRKYDDLSNKEMLEVMAEAVDTAIGANTKLATSEMVKPLSEITERLDKMQTYLLQKEASSGIEKARSDYKDFDDYNEEISNIFNMYPGIKVDDAYILAKGHKVGNEPPQKEIESEKPINLGTRAANAQKRHDDRVEKIRKEGGGGVSKVRSLRSSIHSAVDRVIANRNS